MTSDSELLQRAAAGDRKALAALLELYAPQVRGRLQPKLGAGFGGQFDLDDVMQVTYLEAFLRIPQFENRGEGAFLGWLIQIAENNWRDALRAMGRQKRQPQGQRVRVADWSDSATSLLDELGWTSTTPSRAAGQRELAGAVLSAIDRLPRDYAAVLRSYDLSGQSVEEVAGELGRSTGAVFMLRARALDRLRELLSGFVESSRSP